MPSDDSPWWFFHRLNHLVLNGPPDAAHLVRTRWQPIQDELFVSAHAIAAQAKQLIDEGRSQEATTHLTRYMADNAAQMIATVRTLYTTLAEQKVLA